MINLIIKLTDATSCREVDMIVEQNISEINPFNRTFFCRFANNAKRRIVRINREKKESFKDILN